MFEYQVKRAAEVTHIHFFKFIDVGHGSHSTIYFYGITAKQENIDEFMRLVDEYLLSDKIIKEIRIKIPWILRLFNQLSQELSFIWR